MLSILTDKYLTLPMMYCVCMKEQPTSKSFDFISLLLAWYSRQNIKAEAKRISLISRVADPNDKRS
jgi:hypothetical protein